MTFDSARGVVVLFGGDDSGTLFGDTWEWDGTNWTQRMPQTSPSARTGHALAYDSARVRTVLFGGSDGAGYRNDTWEWDGTNWSQIVPSGSSPSARDYHAMAYDEARRVVVLFGGWNGTTASPQTWEWNGTNWTLRTALVTSPVGRQNHALTYDSARQVVVLCGGWDPTTGYHANTWEWNGSDNPGWVRRNLGGPPSPRRGHSLDYDVARGRTVLFGGRNGSTYHSDTWEWDGITWTQRFPAASPNNRTVHAMAYDAARRAVVLFSGHAGASPFSDTWEYQPLVPADCTRQGTGCPGLGGTPDLDCDPAALPDSLPWVGYPFEIRLRNVGNSPQDIPFLILGASTTTWNGIPLPLDLTPWGMPGCRLYTDLIFTLPLTNQGGATTWKTTLPNNASHVGATLYAQGMVLNPGANPANVVMSNYARLTIGAK